MKRLLKPMLAAALGVVTVSAFAATAPAPAAAENTAAAATATTATAVASNAAAASTTAAEPSTAAAQPLTFGVSTNASQADAMNVSQASYQSFATALSKQLNTPVKLAIFSDQTSLMNAVATGKVDLAYANALPFVTAQLANKNIQPIATVLSWNQGKTQKLDSYSSAIVVLASNEKINKLSDLNNTEIAFARDSAAGFYYPSYLLQMKQIAYSYHFYNDQNEALQALNEGKVAAAVLWDASDLNQKNIALKTLQVINNIPNPVIVASSAVPAAQQAAIKQALLALPETAYTGAIAGVENFNSSSYATAQRAVQSVKGPAA